MAEHEADRDYHVADEEGERAFWLRISSMNSKDRAQKENREAGVHLQQATQKRKKGAEFLTVASISATLLLLSTSPVGFSARDLSLASRGLRETFLDASPPKDPRKQGKWKWQMWTLESLAFLMSFWLAAIIFCSRIPLKATPQDTHGPVSTWKTFGWLLLSVALVAGLRGACVWIWSRADLRRSRICEWNCAPRQDFLRETGMPEILLAANRCAAYGVLGIFSYLALRDQYSVIIHKTLLPMLNVSPRMVSGGMMVSPLCM